MRKLFAFSLALLMIFGLTLGVLAVEPPDKDIVETAIDAPDFDTLVAAVVAAGLVDTLKSPGPFTVFAPTDAAFAALPAGVLDKLLANPNILAKVLLYHVVPGEVLAADVVGLDGEEVATALGQKVSISVNNGDVKVNDANVVATDILCTNGVIHVIDKVLVPQWDIVEAAIMNDDFNTLVAALEAADLVEALKGDGPLTVFAPTDAAFAALPDGLLASLLDDVDSLTKVLLYHVVSGKVMAADVLVLDGENVETLLGQDVTVTVENGKVFINDSEVVVTDIEVTNGVIHVLDTVLVPDLEEEPVITMDIVETAIAAGDFNTLVAALEAADLVSALQVDGPFTVFAPTDDAFAALLAALDITAAELLASDDLANILLYHVVSGEYKAGSLTDGMELEALNGGKLLISISSVMVNDANVIAADVGATNGVIHVIDAVLIPAEEEDEPDVGDGDVELPQTGGHPYYVFGLLALAGGVLTLKKRK